jgi:5-methylcytosine-specific restriction endonuclease McrA
VSDPFYGTPAWKALRTKACRLAGWRCQWCGANLRGRGLARVDHVRTRASAPALALVLQNLRVLCATCDNRRHHEKGGRPAQRFGADGQPLDPKHRWNLPA